MTDNMHIQRALHQALGAGVKIYFQPPIQGRLSYPCVIYSLANIDSNFASNGLYSADRSYNVQLIHDDPNNDVVDKLLAFRNSRFNSSFVSDNLYHYNFTIYF